jgi:RNA polymerase sigma-70 factor (ECF subfamily)
MNINDMRDQLVQIGNGAHALAFQILGNADDAADAVQDALTKVLSRPRAYDARKGAFKPWFLRVVRNRCYDLLRRRRPADPPVDLLADQGAGPEQALEQSQRDANLKRALASLPSDHRQIIALRDYMDLPYAEIAEVLDIAKGTVMSRLHRARLALGEALKDHDN